MSGWLRSAANLLRQADPGQVPFLVDGVIVDHSLFVIQGLPKTTKTWMVLELCRAIVTGEPAFGRFEISDPGPVVLVLEESGEQALHRRLDALMRGNGQSPEQFERLFYAANLGVKLDEEGWQEKLLQAAIDIYADHDGMPVVFLDPLVRMKGAGRDESSQKEMDPVISFMRTLRHEARAVGFVHHVGHEGTRLRGSSDLEAVWESKLTLSKLADGTRQVLSDHREAESGPTFRYRMDWDDASRSVCLSAVEDDLRAKVTAHLAANPDDSANTVHEVVGGNRKAVLAIVRELRDEVVPDVGTTLEPPLFGPSLSVVPASPSPLKGRGPGTTANGAGSEDGNQAEVERLAELYRGST